jgi:hypothetical protein
VELLVCIDVAMPFRVAKNVEHAVHLYRSRRRLYPARPLQAETGSAARVTNIDLDAADSPVAPSGLHHLNITASPAVQTWVVERVLEAVATVEVKRRGTAVYGKDCGVEPGTAARPRD